MNDDPNYKQELKKYDNPIPSREYIYSFIKNKPLTKDELSELLKIDGTQKKAITLRLNAMVRDGQISCDVNGMYSRFSAKNLLIGKVIANPKGFGFIALDKGGKDLKLSAKQMSFVFHGDKVAARLLNKKGEAEVVSIVAGIKTVVGRLHIDNNYAHVVVDDRRIKHNIEIDNINKKSKGGKPASKKFKNLQIVIVEILSRPTKHNLAKGKIIEVLGNYMDEDVEVKSALYRHQIPDKFSKDSLLEVSKLPTTVLVKDKQNRVDLTKLEFITIDGEDSRDFDDAVYATQHNNGWKLFVAIADVSHYVKEGSALDTDAMERGNSVYFPRAVVPMLPEELSNGLCSVNPKVKRLCLTCEMSINELGELTSYKFYPSVIYSHARLTYTKANAIMQGSDVKLIQKYSKVVENIKTLYCLYKILKSAKDARGVMDFERAESKILFNDNGKIDNIISSKRNDAHRLIEECMLMANQASAKFLAKNKEDFLYRIHPQPSADKVEATRKFLAALGLTLEGGDNPTSKDFAKVLLSAKGRIDENVIQTIMLRTMKQATYTPVNEGHFGLAFTDYVHFTSPIRRYPDLLVHRAIKRVLNNKSKKASKKMEQIGQHLSMTERRADDASRDVERWLKCEYMRDKVGSVFTGVISGLSNFAIFIELNDIFVEGSIGLRDLNDDYYVYDNIYHQLKGQRRGQIFKLGDKIKVQLAAVNMDDMQIIFVLTK